MDEEEKEMRKELEEAIRNFKRQKNEVFLANCLFENEKYNYFYQLIDLQISTTKLQEKMLDDLKDSQYSTGTNLLMQINVLINDYLKELEKE